MPFRFYSITYRTMNNIETNLPQENSWEKVGHNLSLWDNLAIAESNAILDEALQEDRFKLCSMIEESNYLCTWIPIILERELVA